ncbi:DUF4340 domain-containing protein [Thermophagus sp. OGC60D27]|uniref:DUF4340 domain-containing protein n=1 Tax=Thermophagus sp. OGC60D27 TaxID=3458415 RepID=UPI004037D19C
MLRKINVKTLAITFLALAIIYAIQLLTAPKGTGNMPQSITSFVADDCNKIVINPKGMDKPNIILEKRNNKEWFVAEENSNNEFAADSNVVKNLLRTMSQLSPMRMATQNKERWSQFDVTDSAGIGIAFYNKNEVLADLIIGRFTYTQSPMAAQMAQRNPYMRQNPGTMSTYVRNRDESEVYAVEGFLSSSVGTEVARFRDKSFFAMQNGIIEPVEFSFSFPGDSSFVLTKQEDHWNIGNVKADSASVAKFLNGIRNLRVSSFAPKKPQNPSHKVVIKGENGVVSAIEALYDNDSTVIFSSQYPDNLALDKNHYLFDKIFVSKNDLLKE